MIRCNRCDHQNTPGHRFCGMCGDSLDGVEVELPDYLSSRSAAAAKPVTGPSFLGLAEPESGGHLLEEEPRPGWSLLYLVIVVLLTTGVIFAWRWRSQGYAWRVLMASHRLLGSDSNRSGPDAGTPPSSEESAAIPNQASAPSPKEDAGSAPDLSDAARTNNFPTVDSPALKKRKAMEIPSPEATEGMQVEETKSPPSPSGDKLAAEGESYLYGRGVPTSCDHARTTLFMAAEKGNPDAQGTLGAMFATGHCVNVDLPAAYRWLARARRQDRVDRYIESNLRIVWKEMTAEQQQMALRDSH